MTAPAIARLTDPRLYSHGDPHATWARLRRECPVSWHDEPDHEPFWAVTTYDEGLAVLSDWKQFSSAKGTFLRPNLSDPYPGAGVMMTLSDPPRHDVLRKAAAALFTPKAAAGFRDRATEVSRSLLRGVIDAGPHDFVNDVAAPYPLQVIAGLLGVEGEDVERVAGYAEAAVGNIVDLDGTAAQQAHLEVLAYYAEVIEERRARPTDDVVSAFVLAQADGLDITDDEIILTCDNLAVAAGETTRQVLSGGLLALLANPGQLDALRSGAVPLKSAIEELVRWTAPVTHLMRTAVADTSVGDVEIKAGQAVSVWLSSLNRDENVFDRPMELRLDRNPNRHVSFGGGRHFCIGAPLARVMIRVFLEETMRSVSRIEQVGEQRRTPSYVTNSLEYLPLAFYSE
ncbi:cytochrome P450 [Streptomyces sp. PKU-EA00015]|uniref:cytochrome P450 n=1 Tax=Streptomyces sp. PKU-EA00015 TaxID=2748326 RepID=UPI00159FBB7F|nr:cytochrome P450 [Streptomyces sp. PKU-EA00015]NWF30167.1 cytochrome P450 [Streptomyces sp. PKU-EA00015]